MPINISAASSASSESEKKFRGLVMWQKAQEVAARLQSIDALPHDTPVASLLHRMFVERIAFLAVAGVLGILVIWQKVENADLRVLLEKPYAFMVPSHIPDVIKIRANTIPDESVFTFAQEMATQLGNTNWEDVEQRYGELKKYMHPTLKEKFSRDMRAHLKLWEARHIDQKFSFKKPEKYDRKTITFEGKETAVFTVEIWGNVRKFVEGRPTEPYAEKMTLKFTTNNISQDRWWIFELIEIQRESAQEIEDQKIINP